MLHIPKKIRGKRHNERQLKRLYRMMNNTNISPRQSARLKRLGKAIHAFESVTYIFDKPTEEELKAFRAEQQVVP